MLDTSNEPDGRHVVHVKMDGDFEVDYGITDSFHLWLYFEVSHTEITRLTTNLFSPSTRTVHAAWAGSGNLSDLLSSLRVAERPFPEKPTTAHDWVLVKMHSASLNQHDIFTLRGIGLKDLAFPLILGNDGVCWRCDDESSDTVCDESQLYQIYNVINSLSWPAGQDGTLDPGRSVLGEEHQGVLSTYAWLPASNLIPIPPCRDTAKGPDSPPPLGPRHSLADRLPQPLHQSRPSPVFDTKPDDPGPRLQRRRRDRADPARLCPGVHRLRDSSLTKKGCLC